MKVIYPLTLDLVNRGVATYIHAVQCDGNTRAVKLTLLSDGQAWQIPENTHVSVAFCNRTSGNKGWYDTLANGEPACTVEGNTVIAVLASAILESSGEVEVCIVFQDENLNQLTSFSFFVLVSKNIHADSEISNDYYRYCTMQQISDAMEKIENQANSAAVPIVCEAGGESFWIYDCADRPLQGLSIYGKTVTAPNTTPSPDAPLQLQSIGKLVDAYVAGDFPDDEKELYVDFFLEDYMPGIPVASGGNYTDENGQQWLCDEIDFAKGVYIQRVQKIVFDGSEDEIWGGYSTKAGNKYRFATTKYAGLIAGASDDNQTAVGLCSHYPIVSNNSTYRNSLGVSVTSNGYIYLYDEALADDATADTLRQAHKSSPVMLLLPLLIPVETPIPEEGKAEYACMRTCKGQTSVYNSCGAYMKLSYVADTKTYIDNKFAALQAALEGGTDL